MNSRVSVTQEVIFRVVMKHLVFVEMVAVTVNAKVALILGRLYLQSYQIGFRIHAEYENYHKMIHVNFYIS